jgi:hypothetical protein
MRVVILRKQVGTDNISVDTLKEEVLSRIRDNIGDLEITQVLELFRAAGVDVGDITVGNASELSDKLLGAAQGMELGRLLALARELGVDVGDIEEQIRRVAEAAQQLAGAGVGPAYGRLHKQMEEIDSPRDIANEIANLAKALATSLKSYSSWGRVRTMPSETADRVATILGELRSLIDTLEQGLSASGVYGSTWVDRIRPDWEKLREVMEGGTK